ncbi:molybdate ABC transporter permease subunit [Kiritimatiellota bacterium B12222]|nr:molybdate ABC transporter permease subunit [Kiritimatiellota bacterium B12222]
MLLSPADLEALGLTLRLAAWVTVLLLLICTPLAWWLSRGSGKIRTVMVTLSSLPMVLPPTVLGFYLLLLMGPHGPVGKLFIFLGSSPPTFRFTGLVIGSIFYSFPFVLLPLQNAFSAIGPLPLEAAATLRAGPIDRLLTIVLPMARPGIFTAAVMGFAHTLGEFGVVLMIGGNIQGETRIASIAIYDHVESLNYPQAHTLAGILVTIAFALLFLVNRINLPPSREGS